MRLILAHVAKSHVVVTLPSSRTVAEGPRIRAVPSCARSRRAARQASTVPLSREPSARRAGPLRQTGVRPTAPAWGADRRHPAPHNYDGTRSDSGRSGRARARLSVALAPPSARSREPRARRAAAASREIPSAVTGRR